MRVDPPKIDPQAAASDWSTAGEMSIATDTELTGDLPSLARALSNRVRTLVQMHAAAGSGLSPRAKNGKRTPSPSAPQQLDVETGEVATSNAVVMHNTSESLHYTADRQHRLGFGDESPPQNRSDRATIAIQPANLVDRARPVPSTQRADGVASDESAQNHAGGAVPHPSRGADDGVCSGGGGRGGARFSQVEQDCAPFPAVPLSEVVPGHLQGSDRVRLRSESGSSCTAPPDPVSLRQYRTGSCNAASGRQSGVVAISAMPGHSPGPMELQRPSHPEAEQDTASGARKSESVDNDEQKVELGLGDRQNLKGELESVRAMIAEMQDIRAAVQRGDLDAAGVSVPLYPCVQKIKFVLHSHLLSRLWHSGQVLWCVVLCV